MVILGDAEDFACEIMDVGNDIEIEHITSTTFNKYGDATDTTGTFTPFKAVCNFLGFEDRMVQEGSYHSGDMIFYIAADETTKEVIKERNKIIYDLGKYEIKEIFPHTHTETLFVFEVRAQRV